MTAFLTLKPLMTLPQLSQSRCERHPESHGEDGNFHAPILQGRANFRGRRIGSRRHRAVFAGTASSRVRRGLSMSVLAEEMQRRHAIGYPRARSSDCQCFAKPWRLPLAAAWRPYVGPQIRSRPPNRRAHQLEDAYWAFAKQVNDDNTRSNVAWTPRPNPRQQWRHRPRRGRARK